MIIDPLYIIIMLPALVLALWAQAKTQSNFSKYGKVPNSAGLTGAEAAARMLEGMGLRIVASGEQAKQVSNAVAIELGRGFLSDHYDPSARTLRLSPDVYHKRSLSAVGVACHEAGHALQHAQGYAALQLRSLMVPLAQFGSTLAVPLIFIGAIIGAAGLINFGIILFTAVVAFQLVTLPVEFDASSRAKKALTSLGITASEREQKGVAAVLNAAAWTYIAAAVSAVLQLIYFLMIASRE